MDHHRYEVEVLTEGGHSYGKFGNCNAIAELSRIIAKIYKVQVPHKEGSKASLIPGLEIGIKVALLFS